MFTLCKRILQKQIWLRKGQTRNYLWKWVFTNYVFSKMSQIGRVNIISIQKRQYLNEKSFVEFNAEFKHKFCGYVGSRLAFVLIAQIFQLEHFHFASWLVSHIYPKSFYLNPVFLQYFAHLSYFLWSGDSISCYIQFPFFCFSFSYQRQTQNFVR